MIESPRHDLDETIDRVAAKMVAAPDDDRILQQVVERLPEREGSRWFLTIPAQVTAAVALVMIAFVFARPSHESAPIEAAPIANTASDSVRSVAPILRPMVPRAPAVVRRLPTADSRLPRVTPEDHEFSLPPVAALPALELSSILAPPLAPTALEDLAPLVLTDLPLASDSFSPHER